MTTNRIEAFSDGVFAIAITLLVLDIKVPRAGELPAGTGLAEALLKQWPVYLAYVTSFLTILIMWINHHSIFQRITRSDHLLLVVNGLLLMGITIVPFPTSLVAEYFRQRSQHLAAAVYSGTFVVIALLFNLLWRYAVHGNRLLDERAEARFIRKLTHNYSFGPPLYLVAFLLAFFSALASVLLCMVLAIFFALPIEDRQEAT